MFFRATCISEDLYVINEKFPIFSFSKPYEVVLFIENIPSKNEQSRTTKLFKITSKIEFSSKKKVQEILRPLSKNKIPDRVEITKDLRVRRFLNLESRTFSEAVNFPLELLPQGFQDFIRSVKDKLRSTCERTVRLIRWRFNTDSPHKPLSNFQFEYSFDEKEWFKLPSVSDLNMEVHVSQELTESKRDIIADLFENDVNEPLSFEVLLEAQDLKKSNPKVSLVLSIIALETGIKECLGKLNPKSEWLLENLPSPPIVKILREYLPQFFKRKLKDGEIFSLDNKRLNKIKKAVSIRNDIVHGNPPDFSEETLLETLNEVKSILMFLEFLKGNKWRINHVQDFEFREKVVEKFV